MSTIDFKFGSSQILTSQRMQRNPRLAKVVFAVFGYTSLGNYARSRVFRRLLNKLPLSSFKLLMDLGAGLGEYTFSLAKAMPNSKFTALEILEPRINALRKVVADHSLTNVEVFPEKIEHLKRNEQYDFIFSVDVFEHIHKEHMPFAECFLKLKKGGYLLVKIPNVTNTTIMPNSFFGEHNEWLDKEHVGQVYDLDGLKKRFTDVGFEIVHAEYADGLLARAGWEISYFSRKLGGVFQLLTLPLCKFLVILDGIGHNTKRGNTIQVIGRKPV